MQVTLVWSWAAQQVREWTLQVPEGHTVAQVLAGVDWKSCGPISDPSQLQVSVWGRAAQGHTPVRDLDRIEITRALRVDPKVARRERFQRQGVRTAGLFARRQRP
jgi:putative ubiquitin-RnfH superfamily antitoxin RatB of RatAB toxin-antitoxin module